jgi:hypothetical protein
MIVVTIVQVVGFSKVKWELTDNKLFSTIKSEKKAMIISIVIMFALPLFGGGFSLLFPQKHRLFVVIFPFLTYLASTVVSGFMLRQISMRREMSKRKKRNMEC